jgi:hypothetical protein
MSIMRNGIYGCYVLRSMGMVEGLKTVLNSRSGLEITEQKREGQKGARKSSLSPFYVIISAFSPGLYQG